MTRKEAFKIYHEASKAMLMEMMPKPYNQSHYDWKDSIEGIQKLPDDYDFHILFYEFRKKGLEQASYVRHKRKIPVRDFFS